MSLQPAERLQELTLTESTLVLARIAQARSGESRFAPSDIEHMFEDMSLPKPARISNILIALERRGLATRSRGRGRVWALTPRGRRESVTLFGDLEVREAVGQSIEPLPAGFLNVPTLELPPSLAPTSLLGRLSDFLAAHPFETNVLCMLRFPDEESKGNVDPLVDAVAAARDACTRHGLELHLASDRAIHDDLWLNVVGHMWASRYGLAFFEDAVGRGVNYNLTIEVGAMLMAGRRCALLRDKSIRSLPTDLVGQIYRPVNVRDPGDVSGQVHAWIRADLALGACEACNDVATQGS